MSLVKSINIAAASEALIHVYATKIVLNSKAVALLALKPGDRVAVKTQDVGERERLYVGKVDDGGFVTSPKGKGCRISSTALCRYLANALDGYGTYKISSVAPEYDVYQRPFYNIWWIKYDVI